MELTLRAELDAGTKAEAAIGELALEPGSAPSAGGETLGETVAICMATRNPPPDLFQRQIESIRDQTHTDWVCLISDDASDRGRLAEIERVIADDPRFRLAAGGERLGFYGNFERALGMVPVEASHVALSDQDDRWQPEKLEALLAALSPHSTLAYSDMRVVDRTGEVLRDTYWSHRRRNHTDLGTLLLGNTITGAAALFRRDLLDRLLPFPPPVGRSFHDHWLALVALAAGPIAYVARPLHDYVQHPQAVIGYARASGGRDPAAGPLVAALTGLRRAGSRLARPQARERYFADYCRTALFARVLEMRCGDLMNAERREAVRKVVDLDDSARSLGWLAARSARSLLGGNETLGVDRSILAGLLWSRMARGQVS